MNAQLDFDVKRAAALAKAEESYNSAAEIYSDLFQTSAIDFPEYMRRHNKNCYAYHEARAAA